MRKRESYDVNVFRITKDAFGYLCPEEGEVNWEYLTFPYDFETYLVAMSEVACSNVPNGADATICMHTLGMDYVNFLKENSLKDDLDSQFTYMTNTTEEERQKRWKASAFSSTYVPYVLLTTRYATYPNDDTNFVLDENICAKIESMIEKNPNTEKAWVSKYIIPAEQFMTNDDDMDKIYQLGKCKLVDGVRANLSKYDKQKHLEVEFDPNKKALLLYATPVIIKTAVPADIPIGDMQLLQ